MTTKATLQAIALTALVALGASCTPGRPSTGVRPPSPPPGGTPLPTAPPPADSPAAPLEPALAGMRWEFRYAPGSYRYLVRATGAITATADTTADTLPAPAGDSAAPAAATERSALYTVRFVPTGTGLTATIAVDSLVVRPPPPAGPATGAQAPADSTVATAGVAMDTATDTAAKAAANIATNAATDTSFQVLMSLTGQLAILPPDTAGDSCAVAGGMLAERARSLIVPLPTVISLGGTWRDSTRTMICAGGLPVAVSAVQAYRVAATGRYQGTPVLRLERSDTLRYQGGGTQRGRSVVVTGDGTGRATYYLDPVRGLVLGGTGESLTRFSVSTLAGGTRTFSQRARQEIALQKP